MPLLSIDFVDDAARWITVLSSLAIFVGLVRLLHLRRNLSTRTRLLGLLLATLVLMYGILSLLVLFDTSGESWLLPTAVRATISLLNVVGAVALWSNFGALLDMPMPRQAVSEQRRLTLELATALQRYEMALRGSNVAIFTQDPELRYTSVSKPLFGFPVEKVLGSTDADLLGESQAHALMLLKRESLAATASRKGETEIEESGRKCWYDIHIDPLRDLSGTTVGLTGAVVDVTERKENEQHLRLLMRELTHRSKNLLAVIQAMARQTARHAGSIDGFVEIFSARLQALSKSHDLLVQESWYGASLNDMVRSQLGHHLDRENSQFTIEGPSIFLKPEAAQNIGLAIHELSTNAAKYGALSVPTGHIDITWTRKPADAGGGFELLWREAGGPSVSQPAARGFGSLVIERNLARALDGKVELDFAPAGLTCHVSVPEFHLTAER
ncbi:sensor histidine kinase [Ancylobacter sp.]|uniref:sensor histidine kinase n=1 Tax=Ancylobacter sp. TaxID=1872567 RepID=UPI003D1036DE